MKLVKSSMFLVLFLGMSIASLPNSSMARRLNNPIATDEQSLGMELSGLANAGQNCWTGCNQKEGACAWCGNGYCCRQGWNGGGCGGSIGGANRHECVAKPAVLENAGQNCWTGCNQKEGPCAWCGNGYCCRQGWNGGGCGGSIGGANRHECVAKPEVAELKNAGQDCWGGCSQKEGPCAWCGNGYCCRQGWNGGGCGGSIGGAHRHECVAKPEVLKNAGQNCWTGCNQKEGACAWCGDGYCCRQGWNGGGCGGKIGGANRHECVAKPAVAELKNAGQNCWTGCGQKEGPCEWCGNGYCCRQGWNGGGCGGSIGGANRHECVAKPEVAELKNAGQNCWTGCSQKEGPCAWCGNGYCCRKGWNGGGCGGSIGGANRHECVAKPPVLKNAGQNCWTGCNQKEGPCAWCGDGYCCRQGWNGGGCGGSIGGANRHECVLKPGFAEEQDEENTSQYVLTAAGLGLGFVGFGAIIARLRQRQNRGYEYIEDV